MAAKVPDIKTPLPGKRAREVDTAVAIFADVLRKVQKEGRSI